MDQHGLDAIGSVKPSFELVFDHMPIGMGLLDPDGRLVVANPALGDFLGVPPEWLRGRRLSEFSGSERCEDLHRALDELDESGTAFSTCYRREDGETLWGKTTLTRIADGHIMAMIENETPLRLAERQVRLRQEQLAQTAKLAALGTLISGVAHEINNPNNFIALNLNRLKQMWSDLVPVLDEYQQDNGDFVAGGLDYQQVRAHLPGMLEDLQKGSERIKDIVSDLLQYGRPAEDDQRDDVDINRVVMRAVNLLAHPIRKATEHFHVDLQPLLPPVRGSVRRLEQVLVNLIQNACQALSDRRGAVHVRTRQEEDRVLVEIQDHGCGIGEEDLHRIRDPFFTTKRSRGGSGLGLWIANTIAEDHGGRLDFRSSPEEGTVATLVLRAGEA